MIPVLELNLATRPFRNNTLIWIAFVLALAALAAFTGWNASAFRRYGLQLERLRQEVHGIERKMAELQLRDERARAGIEKFDLGNLTRQTGKANEVIRWKAFSWTRLFNLLEQVQPYDVKMLAIRPVFHQADRVPGDDATPEGSVPVRVEGVAKDLPTFLEFERSLLADAQFDRVEPVTSNTTKSGETKFELKFLYFPERAAAPEAIDLPPVVEAATPRSFAEAERAYESSIGGTGGSRDAAQEGSDEPEPSEPAEPAGDG
jgi:hypothetical protein